MWSETGRHGVGDLIGRGVDSRDGIAGRFVRSLVCNQQRSSIRSHQCLRGRAGHGDLSGNPPRARVHLGDRTLPSEGDVDEGTILGRGHLDWLRADVGPPYLQSGRVDDRQLSGVQKRNVGGAAI